MLRLKGVTKKYKEKIIFKESDFFANAGEIVLLMGKSGIGKSTLLDILSGIKLYNSGSYWFKNEEVFPKNDKEMSAFRNKYIGYILQDFALIDDYTVKENIQLPSLYKNDVDSDKLIKKIKILTAQFGLEEVYDKKVKEISGGQKQRVAIIRSIILDPMIYLADEPTTNLDIDNFELVIKLFRKLRNEGKIIIIATHDERILDIADRIYRIENYKLIEEST